MLNGNEQGRLRAKLSQAVFLRRLGVAQERCIGKSARPLFYYLGQL